MVCVALAAGGAALAGLTGCARFEARPLSAPQTAAAFEQRSLTNAGLTQFLATRGVRELSEGAWDFERLTLAAFYYHPDLDWARARWRTATAGTITAGQRPNPTLAFTPRLNASSLGSEMTPWILGGVLDLPLETMGKRRYRVAQAQHLSDKARCDLAAAAWLVRSRLRTSLLALQAARETAALSRQQAEALERLAHLVEVQCAAGAVSPVEVAAARAAHQNAQLSLKDAQRQAADARGQVAEAIGVPLRALEDAKLGFADPSVFPTNLAASTVQRQAVLNRADVLSALAEYAASESALQVQIAKQYPDLHLRPGYELDQTKNKWQIGVSLDIPLFNQNQGPIAEARARREEIAAQFNAIQARAIGEIDRAGAVYAAAVDQAAAADAIVSSLEQRAAALKRQYAEGEVDPLVVAAAQAEYLHGALVRLKARFQAQQSLAALENAVQAPLPLPPASLETAPVNLIPTPTP